MWLQAALNDSDDEEAGPVPVAQQPAVQDQPEEEAGPASGAGPSGDKLPAADNKTKKRKSGKATKVRARGSVAGTWCDCGGLVTTSSAGVLQ